MIKDYQKQQVNVNQLEEEAYEQQRKDGNKSNEAGIGHQIQILDWKEEEEETSARRF